MIQRNAALKKKSVFTISFFALISTCSYAKDFNNLVFFGDSLTDSGHFKYTPEHIADPTSYAVTGVPTTPGALMWSETLGQYLSIPVRVNNSPTGGYNYAIVGAKTTYHDSGDNVNPASEQITQHLSLVNNILDPDTLYTLHIGSNDVKNREGGHYGNIVNPQDIFHLDLVVAEKTQQALRLQDAGARYLLIANQITTPLTQSQADLLQVPFDSVWASSMNYYNEQSWKSLQSAGIQFIPFDPVSLWQYVAENASVFGIENTSLSSPACGQTDAYNCTVAELVSATAGDTYFFADTEGHPAAKMQQITADYVMQLLRAPAQIGYIAQQALLNQINNNTNYIERFEQDYDKAQEGVIYPWMLASYNQLTYQDTMIDAQTDPMNFSVGIDYKQGKTPLVLGAYFGHQYANMAFKQTGNIRQYANTVGLHASYKDKSLWLNTTGNYTYLNNQSYRETPLGIKVFYDEAESTGSNISVTGEMGVVFKTLACNHGPIITLSFLDTYIDAIEETGNLTSLKFGSQALNMNIASLGYLIKYSQAEFDGYLKARYSHHLQSLSPTISTSLTTVSYAPSYTLPSVNYKDSIVEISAGVQRNLSKYGTITLGLRSQLSDSYQSNTGATFGFSFSL